MDPEDQQVYEDSWNAFLESYKQLMERNNALDGLISTMLIKPENKDFVSNYKEIP